MNHAGRARPDRRTNAGRARPDRRANATTLEEQVREALDLIRPAIQMDGGDIHLESISGGTVVVALSGTCETCPISPVTLKAGVERLLRDRVVGVEEVVAIET